MSSNDPKERKKKFLAELFDFPNGTMPVGRLDEKSEGLLLMTTDGVFSDRVNRSGIEKEYLVQLDGEPAARDLRIMESGVEIRIHGKPYHTLPCTVRLLTDPPSLPPADPSLRISRHRPSSWLSICVREGKFRQVRKMTAAIGFPTLRLVRCRIGSVKLESMLPGQVKVLDPFAL